MIISRAATRAWLYKPIGIINRTESILIGAAQNPPKKVSRESACVFWLLMLHHKHSRLNGLRSPFGIDEKEYSGFQLLASVKPEYFFVS